MVLHRFLSDLRLLVMKISNVKCNVCGSRATIYFEKKWWCGFESGFGEFNIKGICKNEKITDNNANRR